MHYLILTRDPRGPRVEDGFEWRVRAVVPHWIWIDQQLKRFTDMGYTLPDSLRVERVERVEETGGKPC